MLATTPTQKKGLTLAQSNIIHNVENVEIHSWGFLTSPHIEIVISHKEWDDTITRVALSLHFEEFAIIADILRSLSNDIVTAMVNNKSSEMKVLAQKAEALVTQ
jgi:helix-turn-helix protein